MKLEVVSPALPMAFFHPPIARNKSIQEGNGRLVLYLKSLKMLKAINNSVKLSIWCMNLVQFECLSKLQ